ncbi:BON domain-containing protein, partial [candidate division GN15 bacterium]|nr:BON domain-containing protein [candidate division GN15 bacterium]
TVDTYFDKAQADDIAAQVSGVVAVDNNLMVDEPNEALVYSPYVDYDWWYPYDYDWYVIPSDFYVTSTDWEIQEEIKDEMWWSPYVESDQVNVTVENGKATLTGEVDTWNERLEATTEAYQGGAIAVDNNLTVQYGPEFYR